jgi:chorismate mutase
MRTVGEAKEMNEPHDSPEPVRNEYIILRARSCYDCAGGRCQNDKCKRLFIEIARERIRIETESSNGAY